MRSRWVVLFFVVSCTTPVAQVPGPLPGRSVAVSPAQPPMVSTPPLPLYKKFVVKPTPPVSFDEEYEYGLPGCTSKREVRCMVAVYYTADYKTVLVTKGATRFEERLFVYETPEEADTIFHSGKRKLGLPLRWRGQPLHVAGFISTNGYFVLVSTTQPKRGQSATKFSPRLVLKRYDAMTGKGEDLSFTIPISADWKLQFIRAVNQSTWVMGIQTDAKDERIDSTTLIVCQDRQCGQLAATKPYFDGRDEPLEDKPLPLDQDRLVWMRVGQGESEQLQGFTFQLKLLENKGKKAPSYEVIAEPKVTLPRLPSGAVWLAAETMQERVVYVTQDPSDLAHVRLGCIELADQKPCEGTENGGYYPINLYKPHKVAVADLSPFRRGEHYLMLRLSEEGGFEMELPATRAQLRLVEHPEETVLWWRNVGAQDKPPPSLVVTARAEALSTLPKELRDKLRKKGEPAQHGITVPGSILKAWGEAMLNQHKLDQPTYSTTAPGRPLSPRDFYVYTWTLCQGNRCWERIPWSRDEISGWADMLLQGIPKEDLPQLRQVIQDIRAIAGEPSRSSNGSN